jgi:mannose-6-phosphate isomerase-like protein (cupin superfamily)
MENFDIYMTRIFSFNFYPLKVTKNEVCVTIPAIQSFRVTNTKPVPLKVYPYYDRNQLTVGQFDVK